MQIVTGRRGEPHVTSRQMQAVYRSFLGDFALLDIGEKLRAEAYSNDIVRVYDGVVSVQGIYAVIAYNQYDEVYIEPVSVGKKRIDTIVLHYTKNNTLDVEDMQLDVVQGEEYTDNPIAPVVTEGGDAWEGTTDIQVPIYDVEVTNFGLTVTPYSRMLNLIPTLESIAERIPETVVTGVKGDSEVLYRDGEVNITKANIGLGNVDNTADTDKPISTATQTALNLKADLTYVDAKISAAYHAGGSKTVAELTSALLIADNIGKVYNMSDSGVTTSDFVEGAGEPINEGDNVGICNVGTEESPVYKFDLLSGFVDLSAYATTSAVNAGLEGKVDKVTGKGLSTEDYTTTDKTKLAGISEGATQTIANPADTATETLSKLEVGGVVYDVPQGTTGATNLSELNDVNLSGTAEGDILEYDSTANKWKNSNALQGSKTTTGNPLTIEDAAPVNAVNLSMDLEPIQDLHGYPNPWVGGAGKNKLPMTVEGIKAANSALTWNGNVAERYGATATILTDGNDNVIGIKVNGTPSSQLEFYMPLVSNIGNVIINGCPANGSDTTYLITSKQGSTWTGLYDYGNGYEREITSNESVIIVIRSGYNAQNLIFQPMIRLATDTDSSFAPYSNICPISGRSEETIERVGKNKCPLLVQGTWNIDGTYTQDTDRVRTESMIDVTEGSNYIFSCANSSVLYLCQFFDSNLNYVGETSWTNLGDYISVPQNVRRSTIIFRNATNTNITPSDITQPQFEFGTQSTPYEPYAGKTYTIQLGQDVYGGQLDVTRGKMVVDKGYVDLGSLSWVYDGANIQRFWATLNGMKSVSAWNGIGFLCSNYSNGVPDVDGSGGDKIIGVNRSEIYIRDTSYTDAATFKNALQNSNAQLVYELATPIIIQLTPQQIKLLENTNTIYTDYEGDTITIEYQPNNAIGEAVRAVEESYDPEFAVRPPLKKKAFSGTTDTDGAVTLINASDIPSNHRIIPLQITDMTINGSAGRYFVEYKPYNSGDSVKGYCYTYFNGSQITPVGSAVTGNFYYYDLEV